MYIIRFLIISCLLLIAASQVVYAQAQAPQPVQNPVWLRSLSYGVTTASSQPGFDIHVAIPSASDVDYPCAAGQQLNLDNLVFPKNMVSSSDGKLSRVASDDIKPTPEPGGYSYRLLVGENLPLPLSWTSMTFSVTARCGATTNAYTGPAIKVPRQLFTEPLQLTIKGALPLWYKSQAQDTVTFTLLSTKPVTITKLFIKDSAQPGNQISENFTDSVQSTSRDVRLSKFTEAIKPGHAYTLEVTANDGGQPTSQSIPFNTEQRPLNDYIVDLIRNPENLIVHDTSQGSSVSIDVMTNDSGDLQLAFDSLIIPVQGQRIAEKNSQDKRTHTFVIQTSGLKDGRYSFRFSGKRTQPQDSLNDTRSYTLVVDTTTELIGAIGLKMENQKISLTYCLNRTVDNGVTISRANNTSIFLTQNAGKASPCTGSNPSSPSFAYKVSIDVSDFTNSLHPQSVPGASSQPSTASAATQGAPLTQPIVLSIRDMSANREVIALNLDAIELNAAQGAALTSAIQTLSNDKANKQDKATATQTVTTILKNSAVPEPSIDAIVQFFQKDGKKTTGQAILSALTGFAKAAANTYLGIPAAK